MPTSYRDARIDPQEHVLDMHRVMSNRGGFSRCLPFEATPDEASMLQFLVRYDRATVARLVALGFELTRPFEGLSDAFLSSGFLSRLSSEVERVGAVVPHVALSPDFDLAVIVFVDSSGSMRAMLVENSENYGSPPITLLLPGFELDESRGESVALFVPNENGGHDCVVYSPQENGVHVARITTDDFKLASSLVIPQTASLATMKLSEDVKTAMLVMRHGGLVLLRLESGAVDNDCTLDLPQGEISGFVDHLRNTCIHITSDDGSLTLGWRRASKTLVPVHLKAGDGEREAEERKLCAFYDTQESTVLWIREDGSRAIIMPRPNMHTQAVVYDTSNEEGKKIRIETGITPNDNNDLSDLEAKRMFLLCLAKQMQNRGPCYYLLDALAIRVTEEKVDELILDFEETAINAHDEEGNPAMSLLHHCILEKNYSCAQMLFNRASECGIPVNLCWEDGDILGSAIKLDSLECISFLLARLSEKCSTVSETAAVLSVHFDVLIKKFPSVVEDQLTNGKLSFVYGHFHVPMSVFERAEHRPVAMSTKCLPEWEASSDNAAKEFWIKESDVFRDELKDSSGVQVKAVSRFICIDESVYRENGNIFSELVDSDISVDVFKSEIVRHLLQWKWHTSFRNGFLISCLLHIIAAICFSVFAANFGLDDKPLCPEDEEEAAQLDCRHKNDVYPTRTSAEDLLAARGGLCAAFLLVWFLTFFGMTPILRVFSCYTVSTLFYFAFIRETHNTLTLFLTSIECISFWISVLFYLQPFRATGPLISMIRYVLRDSMAFAMLGLLAITGFGMAFFVLFGALYREDAESGYNSVARALVTTFYAAFGEFDAAAASRHSDEKPYASVWTSVLFGLFVFLGGIVLLSLLIAILGDTYDRVKMKEEAELIKCRARIVGSGNGWNNVGYKLMRYLLKTDKDDDVEEPNMRHSSGELVAPRRRCFHYLVPAEPLLKEKDNTWHGKILALVHLIRNSLNDGERRAENGRRELANALRQIHQRQTMQEELSKSLVDDMRNTIGQLHAQITSLTKEIQELRGRIETSEATT